MFYYCTDEAGFEIREKIKSICAAPIFDSQLESFDNFHPVQFSVKVCKVCNIVCCSITHRKNAQLEYHSKKVGNETTKGRKYQIWHDEKNQHMASPSPPTNVFSCLKKPTAASTP